MLLKNKKLQMFMCSILVIFIISSLSFALGSQDEELKKKYSAILGELGDEPYEFTSDDPESGPLEIKFTKDDKGEYTICTIAILNQGVEISGIRITG